MEGPCARVAATLRAFLIHSFPPGVQSAMSALLSVLIVVWVLLVVALESGLPVLHLHSALRVGLLDPEVLDAVGDHDVGIVSVFDLSLRVAYPQYPRGIRGDHLQRLAERGHLVVHDVPDLPSVEVQGGYVHADLSPVLVPDGHGDVSVRGDGDVLDFASGVASANENEKKHVEELMDMASLVVDGFRVVVADSQYSSRRVRDCIVMHGAESVIPYPSNQARGEPVLRVDRFFRTSGSANERRIYGVGRASVERVNSRLEFVGLDCLKLRGLRRVMVHVLLCIVVMLLVAVAALRLDKPWKARSLASFWW